MKKEISRRDFLKRSTLATAGLVTVGLLGACSETSEKTSENKEEVKFDRECDVLIIGGGGTGVAAAVEAAEAGANTLVIEKSGIMGGSTLMSGGMIHAPEN